MQKFLNTLQEFTGGKEDKDNFIRKTLKTPKLDVTSKKTAYNLFCKDIRKIKKNCRVYRRNGKKVEASYKKTKKYRDLYEEEKRRHEEALQRYHLQDHLEEMEIINPHKSCNKKARKTPQSKKAPKLDEEGQKPKKASGLSDGKKTVAKTGKKVKKTPQSKEALKSPNLLTQSRKERSLLCLG